MPEFLENFLSWYLAPWRRIGRIEFGVALTLATVPGLIIMVLGFGSGAGNFLQPLMAMKDMASSGDISAMTGGLEGVLGSLRGSGVEEVEKAWRIDWTGVLNALCLLAVIPMVRMRLRDIGWFGTPELVMTVFFNISVVDGLLTSLLGFDIIPMGTLWGIVNFLGYGWLTFAKSKARPALHETIPANYEPRLPAEGEKPAQPEPKRTYLNHDPD